MSKQWKPPAPNFLLFAASLILTFAFCESALRLRQSLQGVPFFRSAADFEDPVLGWSGRFFPPAGSSGKKKILFLGDSFTDGLGVPDERLYFKVAAALTGDEPYAYGGKGYGTTQELLVLQRLVSEVKPDLIVLQLCVNDFLNNSWELERQSYLQNALLPRPYLRNGKIELLFPRRFPKIRLFLDSHSRLFHWALMKIEISLNDQAQRKKIRSIEHQIINTNGKLPEFIDAVGTTARLLQMLRETAGDTPIVAFEADEIPPYHQAFAKITSDAGIPLFPHIAADVMDEEKKRKKMRLQDNVHWNEAGHAVAGKALARAILEWRAAGAKHGALP